VAGAGVSIPRSLLLAGPSGVGKTQVARTLANESGLTFIAATTADVKANYLGQSGNRVKLLFERARSSAPAILFLDELDVIAPDRAVSGGNDQLTDEIVGQLLQEMDGISARDGHVFLVAATNHLERIDAAIRSRFQERLASRCQTNRPRSAAHQPFNGEEDRFSIGGWRSSAAGHTKGRA